MKNSFNALLMISSLILTLSLPGRALYSQTNTWTNGNNTGIWNDAGNWDKGRVPLSTDNVVFNNNSSSDDCTIDISPSVKSLTINGNYIGNVSLGSNTLTLAGNFEVPDASQFTSGMGSKVIITEAATVKAAATVYDFEINTAQTNDNVSINQDLIISNDLTITQIQNLNGNSYLRVSHDIVITDPDLDGNSYISAAGASSTITGNPLRRLNVEAGASLELLSNITLNKNFSLTGSGMITGGFTLILGGDADGTVDFSGTVSSDVEINFSNPNKDLALSQAFNISGDLTITQVNNISGSSEVRVNGNITVNDTNVDGSGTSFIVATGNGNLSGTGALRRLKVEAGASLQLTTDFTLNNNFSLTGDGDITGANKLIFGTNGTVDFSGTVPNVEINTATTGQAITFSQSFNISNALDITQVGNLIGSGLEVRVSGDITVTDADIDGSIVNSARLVLAGSATNSFQGAGNGSYRYLIIDKDHTTDVAQLNSSDDFLSITVKKGVLNLNGQSPVAPLTVNSGGTLSGNGTVDGDLTCDAGGVLSPGNSIGAITVTGDFVNNGVLAIEISAIASDVINVSGSATVNGTINLLFIFIPVLNTNYSYSVIVGASSYINSPTITLTPAHSFNGGFPIYSNGLISISISVLPIQLTSFTGKPESNNIHLTWSTATEQ
ncbi:MAG: hypothetical protein KDD02_24210, partial [Phaeodactylibacter sp.]|nr:hypothetical protein [Phaeodactylibacter sp.]